MMMIYEQMEYIFFKYQNIETAIPAGNTEQSFWLKPEKQFKQVHPEGAGIKSISLVAVQCWAPIPPLMYLERDVKLTKNNSF
jgi:hypothetical protein